MHMYAQVCTSLHKMTSQSLLTARSFAYCHVKMLRYVCNEVKCFLQNFNTSIVKSYDSLCYNLYVIDLNDSTNNAKLCLLSN
jgi:hypothetical protein